MQFEIRGHDVSGRIDAPSDPEAGVVVLPGMSHGPFEDVFDRFTDRAVTHGLAVCRLAPWESREELAALSLAAITEAAAAGVDALEERGVSHVDAVGKSFGGGLLLTDVPERVRRLVLWAPAIRVRETGNVGEIRDRPLREVEEMLLGEDRLRTVTQPTLLVHGDADESVDPSVSRGIAAALPNGERTVVAGGDHSFTGEAAASTVSRTLAFLN